MRKFIAPLAVLSVSLLAACGAQAAPIEPMQRPASEVVQVRDLCGLGRHRDPWGRCLPNGMYYYPPYYGYPVPACWWQPGPAGPVRICN
jgi:hypothetical protein